MIKSETIYPLDIELYVNGNQTIGRRRIEQIWLTASQYEVLEIVARVLDQTVSEYLTETVLSMLECEIEGTIPCELEKKLERSEKSGSGTQLSKESDM